MADLYTGSFVISSLISDADAVVKIVILLLFLASFCSWSIVFDKIIKFRSLNRKAKKFNREFWSGKDINELYNDLKEKDNHPMSHIFIHAMNEWSAIDHTILFDNDGAKERFLSRIYQAMMIAKHRSVGKIQKNISFLATIASSSPFIGLFGTVWGIMNSFSAIVSTQNTNLSAVAPGISEALFATAIGLFAAIPALIFYNYFSNKLNDYEGKLEDFSTELMNIFSRELDKIEG